MDAKVITLDLGYCVVEIPVDALITMIWGMLPDIIISENLSGNDRLRRVGIKAGIKTMLGNLGIDADIPRGVDYINAMIISTLQVAGETAAEKPWAIYAEAHKTEDNRPCFTVRNILTRTDDDVPSASESGRDSAVTSPS